MKSYYVVMTQLKQAIREYLNDSLGDFIEYARKHGVDIQVIKSENPDTFKKIFGEPCEDAISREDVLDLCDSDDPEYKICHLKEDVECLPFVQPKTGWIPVSKRLPEKPDNYPYCGIYRTYFLVSLASGCVKTLGFEFDRDEWQVTGSPVVAWMPLPEPYRAESEVTDADSD